MRTGMRNKILVEDGIFYGINLGADFVAEHEWGIKELKQAFGMPEAPTRNCHGIDARAATRIPSGFRLYDTDTATYLMYEHSLRDGGWLQDATVKDLDNMLRGYGNFVTAWDRGSFGIKATDDNDRQYVRQLHHAFMNNDGMIMILSPTVPVFENGGLGILVRSALQQDSKISEDMAAADLDNLDLQLAAEKTGIHAVVKEAGKNYFALSPRWENASKQEVVFWLNPMEQHLYKSGWFSVADLQAWARNEGPVIK